MKLKRLRRAALAVISLVCAVTVVTAVLPGNTAAASATAKTTDYLNLRAGASTSSKVILTLAKGATVTILDNSNPSWAKVRTVSGKQGYCYKQYLSISGASASSGTQTSLGTAVTTDNLNLRTGAATSASILTTMKKGTTVTVLDRSNAQWTRVRTSNGKTGYCSSQYLKFSTSPSSAGGSASKGTAVTTDYLNLRSGAGMNYAVLQTLAKGATVTVLDHSNAQWAKVRTANGREGYCSKQYLEISNTGSSGGTGGTPSNPSGGNTDSQTSLGTAVTTDNLNLRTGATTSASILTTMKKGTTVTVLDRSNAQWTRVRTPDGKTGYCSSQYLKFSNSPPSTGGSTSKGTAVTTDYLNLRSGAGTNYAVLLTLAKGATVTVLDHSNAQWAKVRTASGREGYCSKQYLKISNSGSSGGTGGTPSDPSDHTITGARVTADVLRLREQPGTASKILANLPNGTILKVLNQPASGWVRVQSPDGKTGYVSAEFVKILYSDDPVNSASSLTISASSGTIPMGKTLYLQMNVTPDDAVVVWSSSNPAVASVANGYVYGASKGSAVITASSGARKVTCKVTVTDAEPVKTAFASPNIAGPGERITLTAVTDSTRSGVKFTVRLPGGGTKTVNAGSVQEETMLDTHTKKWTAEVSFTAPGTYSFTAYSSRGGSMSTAGFSSNAYVSTNSDFRATSTEERRVSDRMIQKIANWEGYRAAVYADQLTLNQVPTIGYGCTFGANAVFYNNMTQTEAWSMLVNKINNSSYTSELNKMIRNFGFRVNQNQADALISFAYNVGAGYFNSSTEMDFRKIMRNAVVPPAIPSAGLKACATKDTYLRVQANIQSLQAGSVPNGSAVTVIGSNFSDTRNGWYQVRLSNGKTGWLNSGYVSLSNAASLTHDLNYTNAYAFGTDLIRWSHAGNKLYAGLFYRRLNEANVYSYGDYDEVRYNKYGYTYPGDADDLA